jgi:hypothetical protein
LHLTNFQVLETSFDKRINKTSTANWFFLSTQNRGLCLKLQQKKKIFESSLLYLSSAAIKNCLEPSRRPANTLKAATLT